MKAQGTARHADDLGHEAEDDADRDCDMEQADVAHGDVAEDCEVADQSDQQECAVAQGDLAQECEVAECDQQECAVAQGGTVHDPEQLPEHVKDMLVRHYTCQRPANPEEIHSQVLLRSASEVEAVYVRPLHLDVPVPDTPLKTPDRGTDDVSTTPSTVKVYRNTSSYKAVASPVPFIPDGPMTDVLMEGFGENPPISEVAASGSNQQMVVARELFPDTSATHDDPMPPVDTHESETLHDNPYSRECAVVAKRGKEPSVSGTPLKPDLKKAKMLRHGMAQDVWLSVVYPLKDAVPDAMPPDCILDGRLSYAIAPPDDMPEVSELWAPEELAEMKDMPVRKSITVLLNARAFYVNKCYFHGEFEIGAFWTA
ncbi:unnamed protein product [Symbiodinium sp. CCMP2592]|nr:unnamed protein product [Symbiodinium sp. CCMP2592]